MKCIIIGLLNFEAITSRVSLIKRVSWWTSQVDEQAICLQEKVP